MAPYIYEDEFFLALSALTSSIPSMLLGLVAYVLTAWALYTIASRRQIRKPWLAWIPVANVWILGSLSDQYQYLVKGQNKSKRKVLVILNVLMLLISLVILVLFGVMIVGAFALHSEAEILSAIMGPAMGMLGMCVPLIGIAIADMIIRYMALYDIYRSLDPGNSTLFLILSIVVNITEPFFLFFSRNKDLGMPPRKQAEPQYIPNHDPNRDPWAPNSRDSL